MVKKKDIPSLLSNELQKLSKLSEREKEKATKELQKKREISRKAEREAQLLQEEIENGELTLDYFTDPTKPFGFRNKKAKQKAYIATFKNHPEYTWVAFAPTKGKAYYQCQKAIRDYYFPGTMIDNSPVQFCDVRLRVAPELMEYYASKKVPIDILLKLGFTFNCCECRKRLNYEDYQNGNCIVLEGEGDAAPFALNKLICKECSDNW